jgi:hypothetical protein
MSLAEKGRPSWTRGTLSNLALSFTSRVVISTENGVGAQWESEVSSIIISHPK